MPSRVINGDALWTSRKIAQVEPLEFRSEYSWMYAVAESNGVFELDARAIWARCYAFARPNIDFTKVEAILTEFERVKLLFPFEQDGHSYAYWTGSNRPGRRPRKSWLDRQRKNGNLPPDPPEAELQAFLTKEDSPPARRERVDNVQEHAGGVSGFGLGTGTGRGVGEGSDEKQSDDPLKTSRKKKILEDSPRWNDALNLSGRLADGILRNNPNHEISDPKTRRTKVRLWAIEIEKLLRLNQKTPELVSSVIDFCQADTFWSGNILSGSKLREKFEQLTTQMLNRGEKNDGKSYAEQRDEQSARAAFQ